MHDPASELRRISLLRGWVNTRAGSSGGTRSPRLITHLACASMPPLRQQRPLEGEKGGTE